MHVRTTHRQCVRHRDVEEGRHLLGHAGGAEGKQVVGAAGEGSAMRRGGAEGVALVVTGWRGHPGTKVLGQEQRSGTCT